MGALSPSISTTARPAGLIGANGSSLSSPPRTTGSHWSKSSTRRRAILVFAWPRSPRKTTSWPASTAFSMAGMTVSSKPTMPLKSWPPVARRASRFARSSSLTVRGRQPLARRSPSVRTWLGKSAVWSTGRSACFVGRGPRAYARAPGASNGGRVRLDRAADVVRRDRPRSEELLQKRPTTIRLDLVVARTTADPDGELWRHAPAEVLECVRSRVPGCEDRGTEALQVTVDIAGHRTDVVGGHHASALAIDTAD